MGRHLIQAQRCGVFGLVVALAASLGIACRSSTRDTRPRERPNVVLVTIDTLRADRLGCYGYTPAATPTLDGLAARGVRFETAIAHVPLTGPSHASILTGRTPLAHGMRDNGAYVLPERVRSVAEDFQATGYTTAAFVSGFPLSRRFGLDRGFATYDDRLPRGRDPRRPAYVERTADETTDAALRWLDGAPAREPAKPFFLWVHYFDPHAPYEAPAEQAARAASPYDGEIAFVDAQLGRLLGRVGAGERAARTLVLVTADHGESLGEHGEDTHGIFVYDATLRVPFLVAGPGVPPGAVSTTVARGIDVAPTLLDLAGLEVRPTDGRSLRTATTGGAMPDAPAYAESLHAQLQYGWAPLHALRSDRFKLIEAPRVELYDLADDEAETQDRSADEPARLQAMRRELRALMATRTPSAERTVDAETAERLAALGYIGGGGPGGATPSGRDPKDGIGLVTRLGRNGMTVARTEPARAIRELTALLAEDPGMMVARRTRAVAYQSAGRHDDAIRDLRALESRGGLTAEDSVLLGDSLRVTGRTEEALQVLERAIAANPKFAQPWLSVATLRLQQQKTAEAAAAYAKVLELTPDHTEGLRGRGDVALIRGDLDGAARSYARLLEVDERDVGALTKLGVVKVRTGRAGEGMALFRKALERDPSNGEALLYLAGALASTGRPAEALPYFERALAAGPRTTMALNGLALARLALGDAAGAKAAFRESLVLDPRQPDIVAALRDIGRR